jgi:hypothetical protein
VGWMQGGVVESVDEPVVVEVDVASAVYEA